MIKNGNDKICTCCLVTRDVSEFHVRRKSLDGLSLICKACTKTKHAEHYAKKKEACKAKAKEWARANPEKRVAIRKKSAAKHIDKKRAAGRDFQRRRREVDPINYRLDGRRFANLRRSRLQKNGGNISYEWWKALFEVFEYSTCLYCGKEDQKLEMDHFIPVSKGGRTEVGNLVPCCITCNRSKSTKMPDEWIHPRRIDGVRLFLRVSCEAIQEETAA